MKKRKVEIESILKKAGISYKKSWKKDKLIDITLKECPKIIEESLESMYLVRVNQDFIEAARNVKKYIDKSTKFYKLLLGFGISTTCQGILKDVLRIKYTAPR